MTYIDFHDATDGPLTRCQICNSADLKLVIDLGHQPLCDSLLTETQLKESEENYPLRLFRCVQCSNTQLDYVVPGEKVYHREYPYRCGITREVVEHHERQSVRTVKKHHLDGDSFVVDIGSNDGTLLNAFKQQGLRVLGVEPTNIAQIANENGVETIQSPFTAKVAEQIEDKYGKASLITATNVFAHMATLGEVIRGILVLLKEDGVFIFENHYLLEIIRRVQYDSIYHEHIRSYSLKALVVLFSYYDLSIIDAEIVGRYGGTIRVTVGKGKRQEENPSVRRILHEEENFGLYSREVYEDFRRKSIEAKHKLVEIALEAASKGERFVGNSCPGRCSTLLNFSGIGRDLMPYIAEQPTSLKLGLYLPGKHIPVVVNDVLIEEQPDYVVLLAWHLWEPISKQLRERGLKSKFVIPLPEVRIVDS